MSTLALIALIYALGFLAVIALTWLTLRSEPTAHGQIVGRQVGCLCAIFWPLVLVWIAIVGLAWGIRWLWDCAAAFIAGLRS